MRDDRMQDARSNNMLHHHAIRTWVLLFLVNGLVLTAGFTVFLRLSISANEKTAVAQTEQNMRIFSHSLAALLEEEMSDGAKTSPVAAGSLPQPVIDAASSFAAQAGVNETSFRITVVAPDGTVIADSNADPKTLENHGKRTEVAAALAGTDGVSLHKSSVDGRSVMYYATPLSFGNKSAQQQAQSDNSHELYALRLSLPLERTVFFTANMARSTVIAGICILLLTLVCSFIISIQIINPLNELQLATTQYERGNFAYRVSIKSPYELAELGDSFTHMASTIEENIARMEKLERVRKDFVANVSHELRTPITSIKGFTETLADGAVDDKEASRHFLQIISQQTDRLNAIIEDLLTLSRLEQNDTELEKHEADITELMGGVCETFIQQAQKKKITIVMNGKPLLKCVNEGLMSQALGNIVDNAIKYCPEGSTVTCAVEKIDGSAAHVPDEESGKETYSAKIIIEDNGPGIPEEYRQRVFERFFRVDKGRSRDMGGTGLGLSIVKHIVELHGGTVQCLPRSDGTHGTRFEVTL